MSNEQVTDSERHYLYYLEEHGEEMLVTTALMNYEVFHNMPRGTANYHCVASTSAGIEGWAFSELEADAIATWLCKSEAHLRLRQRI